MITDNLLQGHEEKTHPQCIPIICNMWPDPDLAPARPGVGSPRLSARVRRAALQLLHRGVPLDFRYRPERYKDHETIVDRMYSGEIDPPTLENVLKYMGIGVISEGGRDGHDYRWVEGFRARLRNSQAASVAFN